MKNDWIKIKLLWNCRFHLLNEFDEGKRSCRRRLAGHNKRRRKPQSDVVASNVTLLSDSTRSATNVLSIFATLSHLQCKSFSETILLIIYIMPNMFLEKFISKKFGKSHFNNNNKFRFNDNNSSGIL